MDLCTIQRFISILTVLRNEMSSILEGAAMQEIDTAKVLLQNAGHNEIQIRQGLTHLEVARSLAHKDSYDTDAFDFLLVRYCDRRRRYSKLCYLIAKLHYDLGDDYSVVLDAAERCATFVDIPYEFSNILTQSDYESLVHRDDWIREADHELAEDIATRYY